MREVTKYLKEGEYKKFVEKFPQDRIARVTAAKYIADICASINRKRPYVSSLKHKTLVKTSTFHKIAVKSFNEFDIVTIEDNFNDYYKYYNTELTVVLGEDDSGAWIEVIADLLDNKADVFLALDCGETYKGKLKLGKTRIQGDINLEYMLQSRIVTLIIEDLPVKLGDWFMKHPQYYVNVNRILVDYAWSPEKRPEGIESKDYKEFVQAMEESRDDYYEFVGANKTWRTYDFQNHSIMLYNATFATDKEDDDNYIFDVPSSGGKIKVLSPHHEPVEINLLGGEYILSKSGGISLNELHGFTQIYTCPIYHSNKRNEDEK